jgi:hypothetical protein
MNKSVNQELLADLKSKGPLISDEQIIAKLRALPDLFLGLWGPHGDNVEMPRSLALHHAARFGRTELLRFILANRSVPEQVSIANEDHYTALRCAHRERRPEMPTIISILEEAGAVEEYPALNIVCRCGAQFEVLASERAKYTAQNFHIPKHCRPCRAARKGQPRGINNPRNKPISERGGQWRVPKIVEK